MHCFSLSEKGPWQQVLETTLKDSRNQSDPLPLNTFNFNYVTARYVKFKLLSYWGLGGGLQYFNVKKSQTTEASTEAPTTESPTTSTSTQAASSTSASQTTASPAGKSEQKTRPSSLLTTILSFCFIYM